MNPTWDRNFSFEVGFFQYKKGLIKYFQKSLEWLRDKSLAIAIWDQDSKSRDDYMSGIRISLEDVAYFSIHGMVTVELQHQELDGHVSIYQGCIVRRLRFDKFQNLADSLVQRKHQLKNQVNCVGYCITDKYPRKLHNLTSLKVSITKSSTVSC